MDPERVFQKENWEEEVKQERKITTDVETCNRRNTFFKEMNS